ncbi:MAG TPA: type I restriction-modification system subunit M [Firmicutes bacterium]|jgi:uncharacterized protein YchJ|nr:type I restriction-modification system subunit M [Bacillota bacterium]
MDNRKEQERAELFRTIWNMANDLRGSVDGWDFKQYVLGMLFYRYISENITAYINAGEWEAGNTDFDYAKLSDEEAEQAREDLVKTKGFFILPSELFENVRARAKDDENLNETLEKVFKNIEASAQGTESEDNFKGLFDDLDVNSNKLGTTVAKRNEKLVKLLNTVAEMKLGDFKNNNIDAFGDAYEYLMGMYPCGSGKKYKKCCIGKSNKLMRKVTNENTIPIEDSVSDFDYIQPTAKKLERIISRYNIDDVTRAIYCINAWANNRSALAQALTLNQAVSNVKKFGNQNIKEYSDFKAFFDAVATYLPITEREDLTLNDFGEVKIIVDGETYPVILGTGYEQVYAAMNFLPVLAEVLEMTSELKTILHYNRKIINELVGSNSSLSGRNYRITFELPSERFWQAVNSLFSSNEFLEYTNRVFQIMGHEKCPIEMRHFYVYKEDCYPLYNASMSVDGSML